MDYTEITVDVKDAVGRITFNRPKLLNAYSEQMTEELSHAVEERVKGPGCTGVVITGTGRAFMAGADISMLKGWPKLPAAVPKWRDLEQAFLRRTMLEQCPKPVIAAVNGLPLAWAVRLPWAVISGSQRQAPSSPSRKSNWVLSPVAAAVSDCPAWSGMQRPWR